MRYGVHLRAMVGVLVAIVLGFFCMVYPEQVCHWIREHRFLDGAIAVAGGIFHLWNTYQLPVPLMLRGD